MKFKEKSQDDFGERVEYALKGTKWRVQEVSNYSYTDSCEHWNVELLNEGKTFSIKLELEKETIIFGATYKSTFKINYDQNLFSRIPGDYSYVLTSSSKKDFKDAIVIFNKIKESVKSLRGITRPKEELIFEL